jgi:ATP-dependent exoDNAse (exonuclease V) beta subunit
MSLAKKNSHERDKRIVFDEGPHLYYVDGKKMDISVTGWVHSHFPHFNADKVIDKMMKSKKWSQSKYFGKTKKEIKEQWKQSGLQASAAGTKLHLDIENFYNGLEVHNDSIEYLQFLDFHEKIGSTLTPYRTEWTVFDEELNISGSIDMIFKDVDGTLLIYDWKRSKGIKKTNSFESATTDCINHLPNSNFWHYSLQLNTYKMILERKYGKKVSGMYLVSLHPIQDTWKRIKVPTLETEMNDLIQLRLN